MLRTTVGYCVLGGSGTGFVVIFSCEVHLSSESEEAEREARQGGEFMEVGDARELEQGVGELIFGGVSALVERESDATALGLDAGLSWDNFERNGEELGEEQGEAHEGFVVHVTLACLTSSQ